MDNILIKVASIAAWASLGYFAYMDPTHGALSAVGAVALMCIFYRLDNRSGSFKSIMQRLDFLEETIEGAQDTQQSILDDLLMAVRDIEDDGDYSEGEKDGLLQAHRIVKNEFDLLFKKLASEKEERSQHL